MSHNQVYLDYASGTPTDPSVLHVMEMFSSDEYGNPSSLHRRGRKSARALIEAREKVAEFLHAKPSEIIFTASGTESNHLALLGVARAHKEHGKHILVSSIEHKAVLGACEILQQEGFEVEYIPVTEKGVVAVESVRSLIREDTILVSVMYVNNEIGTIQPIQELGEVIVSYRTKNVCTFPLFHTDACQATAYCNMDVTKLHVDLMTISGTKVYGPKGVAVLFKKEEVTLSPLLLGGGQEGGLRSGTENLPAICGLAQALLHTKSCKEEELKRLTILRDSMIRALTTSIEGIVITGGDVPRAPHILHVIIPYVEGESLLLMLDERGFEVATGSACSSHSLSPSHVLLALGQDPESIHGSIRISFGRATTQRECEDFVFALFETVTYLRNISSLTTTYAKAI